MAKKCLRGKESGFMTPGHGSSIPRCWQVVLVPKTGYHLLRTSHVPGSNPRGINKAACGQRDHHARGSFSMVKVLNREMKRDRE